MLWPTATYTKYVCFDWRWMVLVFVCFVFVDAVVSVGVDWHCSTGGCSVPTFSTGLDAYAAVSLIKFCPVFSGSRHSKSSRFICTSGYGGPQGKWIRDCCKKNTRILQHYIHTCLTAQHIWPFTTLYSPVFTLKTAQHIRIKNKEFVVSLLGTLWHFTEVCGLKH